MNNLRSTPIRISQIARLFFLLAVGLGVTPSFAMSGAKPQVQLTGFQGVSQETNVWCWAAVTQMAFIQLRHPVEPPAQCQIVTKVLGHDCCSNPNADSCVQTHDIEDAVKKVTLSFKWANPSASVLTTALDHQQVPVVLLVNSNSSVEHVVIAYGYSRSSDGKLTAYLWDPSASTPHELEVGEKDLDSRYFYNDWNWAGSAVVSK